MPDDYASFELGQYEEIAKMAVSWWDSEKRKMVKAIQRQKKPFSKDLSPMEEYRELSQLNWGHVVAERGIDQARRLAKRYFELRRRFGGPGEVPPEGLQDHHVSPHPRDPFLNENLP